MYATNNGLLNKSTKALPVLELKTEKELADDFLSFFIAKVKNKIELMWDQTSLILLTRVACFIWTKSLICTTWIFLHKAMLQRSLRISPVRPVFWIQSHCLVKDKLHTLLPILTKEVNSSLTSGTFPDTPKQSIITLDL